MSEIVKDFRGEWIFRGDTIVYATRHGSHLELHEAEVLEVEPHRILVKPAKHPWREYKRPVWLTCPEYITKIVFSE